MKSVSEVEEKSLTHELDVSRMGIAVEKDDASASIANKSSYRISFNQFATNSFPEIIWANK